MEDAAKKPLRVLSLDGGGIRGLSSLLILENIMIEVSKTSGLHSIAKPCDCFDLIGGTSTGGIIAIMLGRLSMTVSDCIRAYKTVAQHAFTPRRTALLPASPSGAFSARHLEFAIKQTIRDHCLNQECAGRRASVQSMSSTSVHACTHEDALLFDPTCTKTAVLSITKANVDVPPTLFTSYNDSVGFEDMPIWQAARATSAATTFFKPMRLGREKVEYIDAAFGYNNPCEILIEEAEHQFPEHGRKIILSIGTGLGNVSSLRDSRSSIVKSLKKMAISSRKVALSLDHQYGDGVKGSYFRLNVERGLEDVKMSDWDRVDTISAHTKNYLEEDRTRRTIRQFVDCLIHPSESHPLKSSFEPASTPRAFHHVPFPRNKRFVGREAIIDDLLSRLFPPDQEEEEGQRVALFGLGGMGKTQTTLHLAHWVKENKLECSVFWIPVLSREGFKQACVELVRALGLPGGREPEEALCVYLTSKKSGDWLLIIDNADDARLLEENEYDDSKSILDYLPPEDRGRILFTTRSREVAVMVADSDFVQLLEMSGDEGRTLLSRSLLKPLRPQDEEPATELLRRLTHLPLAIVQASAYMKTKDVPILEYLKLCNSTSTDMINLLSSKLRDTTLYSKDQRAVATTWIISFNQIQESYPLAADILRFIAWLEPKAIPRSILPNADYEQQKTEALGILCQYGFLSRREDTDMFDMHSLAHLAAKEWLAVQGSGRLFQTQLSAVEYLARSLPLPEWTDPVRHELWQRSLPHALHVYRDCHAAINKSRARLGHLAAAHMLNTGVSYVRTAELLKEVVLQYDALGFTPDNDWRLSATYRLAIALFRVGRESEALPLQAEVVKLRSQLLPKDDMVLLSSKLWLARMYVFEGHMRSGVELLEEAVLESEALPQSDLKRLERRRYLAEAYLKNGQHGKALGILNDCAEVCAEELHPDNVMTNDIDSSLAMAYQEMGDVSTAVKTLERVVASRIRTTQPCHPIRVATELDLARTYLANGQPERCCQILHAVATEFGEELDDDILVREVQEESTFVPVGRIEEILAIATRGRLQESRLRTGVPLDKIDSKPWVANLTRKLS